MQAVLANGPVGFTNAQGQQVSIPLTDLYFDDKGAIQADKWVPFNTSPDQASIASWLKHLVKSGDLVKDPTPPLPPPPPPPPTAAMLIAARDKGVEGNSIQIVVSGIRPDPADSTKTIFDVKVTETDTYTGLTAATIQQKLGNAAGAGLVFVSSLNPGTPIAGPSQLVWDGVAANSAKATIKKADNTDAFELTAKRAGADGANTAVTITIEDPVAETFTLVALWTKTATGIEVADLGTNFDYEITVDPPVSGGTILVPASGTIVLSGGADAMGPVAASAVVAKNP